MQEFIAAAAVATEATKDLGGAAGQIGMGSIAAIAVLALREVALRRWPRPTAAGLTENQKKALYDMGRNVEDLVESHGTTCDDGSADWKLSTAYRREEREHKKAMADTMQNVASTCHEISTTLKQFNSQPRCASQIVQELDRRSPPRG